MVGWGLQAPTVQAKTLKVATVALPRAITFIVGAARRRSRALILPLVLPGGKNQGDVLGLWVERGGWPKKEPAGSWEWASLRV